MRTDLLRRRLMSSTNNGVKYDGDTLNLTNIGEEVSYISLTAFGTFAAQLYCKKDVDKLYKKWKYEPIELFPNETLMIWGDSTSFSSSTSNYGQFSISGSSIKAHGRVSSLSPTKDVKYTFFKLFNGCDKLTEVDKHLLDGIYVPTSGYAGNSQLMRMFCGTGLQAIPDGFFDNVPNSVSGYYSHLALFSYMFADCSRLVYAPKDLLKGRTIACQKDYQGMFQNCTALQQAPDIYTTTAQWLVCNMMFQNCTSLQYPPEIPTTTAASHQCFAAMFKGCTSLMQAPKLNFVINSGASTHIASMFENCQYINEVHVKFTSWGYTNASNGLYYNYATNWLTGCAATGTVYCPQALIDVTPHHVDDNGNIISDGDAKTAPAGWTMIANDIIEAQ